MALSVRVLCLFMFCYLVLEENLISAQLLPMKIWKEGNKQPLKNLPVTVSQKCREDLLTFSGYLRDTDMVEYDELTWADYMADSSGDTSASILLGHFYWVGDYLECIRITVTKNNSKDVDFYGKYCLVFANSLSNNIVGFQKSMQLSICSPSSCTHQDLKAVYSTFTDSMYALTVNEDFCYTRINKSMDDTAIGISVMIGIFAFIVLIATMYEIVMKIIEMTSKSSRRNGVVETSLWKSMLLSFSALYNLNQVFGNLGKGQDIAVLHGIRAISMSWVIVGHTFSMLTVNFPWHNEVQVFTFIDNYSPQILLSAEFAVDTFLFITAFLTVRGLLSVLQEKNQFNYFFYLFYRLIRILPSYLFVIAFMSGPMADLGNGPLSGGLFHDREVCRRRWWHYSLFIDIYFDNAEKCLPQGWYLCLDWAFCVIYPFIIYPFFKKPIVGYVIFGLLFIASILVPFTFIFKDELEPILSVASVPAKRQGFLDNVYEKPWGRAHVGLIGLAFGYLSHILPKEIKMNLVLVYFLWAVSGVVGISLAYGCHSYISGLKAMDLPFKVMYGTFSRPAWGLIVGWVIIACTYGYGGVINKILSWKGFVPLSRLSYCMYLIHFTAIGLYFGSLKSTIYIYQANIAYILLQIFTYSVFAAICLNLLVEGPFIRLNKLFLK